MEKRGVVWRRILVLAGVVGAAAVPLGCKRPPPPGPAPAKKAPVAKKPERPPIPTWKALPPLGPGETYRYENSVATKTTIEAARAAGLLDVDLSDAWAPAIFPNLPPPAAPADADPDDLSTRELGPRTSAGYRATFLALANDKINADGLAPRRGEHNYLEVFGIPPALSVLAARVDEDVTPEREGCYDRVDLDGLRQWTGNLGYLDRDRSKRDYMEAVRDAAWVDAAIEARAGVADADGAIAPPPTRDAVLAALREDPKARGRVDRYLRGQSRLHAVRAAQARLVCEGLLSPRSKFVDGQYDLPTHEALAVWERKNDVFGWGFLGGETLGELLRPTRALHLETFRRVLAERLADAAGIVEDGSINAARRRNPPTYRDDAGVAHPVPDLIGDHVAALLKAIGVATPEQMVAFLRAHRGGFGALHVAIAAPALPPYYTPEPGKDGAPGTQLALSVEIDRGDVWYDVPFDARGKPIVQRRDHYPHLTMFVQWHGQKIPLCWWRTTIGSWRSEVHADGHVYMKYKNSDFGPRVWKHIVAAPVWIPPDSTPAKDLLTRKVLDRNVGPVTVVNTDVMGPGFQSAYGLVMAIHIDPKRGGFDNQIRTHGSVDYTSIARRFSHGCHRLVNNRAVRLFNFVLRHRTARAVGDMPLNFKKRMEVDGEIYRYQLKTRGYYYELAEPVPVNVFEGRVMGAVKKPIVAYVRKPGVDYSAVDSAASGDAAASTTAVPPPAGEAPAGGLPDLGP